jgi:RNA polymerase-binding transcription factor DksA
MSTGPDNRNDNTEVFDEVDLAQMHAQNELDSLLAAHKEKMKPETHPDFDGKHCVDCDVVIPKVRLSMGKVRCVDCQTKLERMRQLYPGRTFE